MSRRPIGDITTLLDLTNRDAQENDLFPLNSETTWFTRNPERRLLPFVPLVQELPYRGPAQLGQRFTFDLGSTNVGDLLFGTVLQIRLGHWLDPTTRSKLESGAQTQADPSGAWQQANGLGASIIQMAELEIDGDTIERIDGDFIQTQTRLIADLNRQFGSAVDHLGLLPIPRFLQVPAERTYPTEDGILNCPLHFFFMRQRYQNALPMIGIREGLVRIHVILRPFEEIVRKVGGTRESCMEVPLNQSFTFQSANGPVTVQSSVAEPLLESLSLLTYGALTEGSYREAMLRKPFEILHRELQTFTFDEPLKYAVSKTHSSDTIRIQLPLEANHPLEEILWFVRRKAVGNNNEWLNFSTRLEPEWRAQQDSGIPSTPPAWIQSVKIQVNGTPLIEAEGEQFRQQLSGAHRGGIAGFRANLQGYSFSRSPGQHQPNGTANASRAQDLRLTLEVRPPGGAQDAEWEVKVFCIGINWLRFQNGMANAVFED